MSDVKVTEHHDGIAIRRGEDAIHLDRHLGSIRHWQVGDKILVAEHDTPPLHAQAMSSAAWDGMVDHVPDARFHEAGYRVTDLRVEPTPGGMTAVIGSELAFAGGAGLRVNARLTMAAPHPHIHLALQVAAVGDWSGLFLRQLAWQLPLALDRRKRVAQGGDGSRIWDSRHLYDFHARNGGPVLAKPDHNEWHYFAIEQDSRLHFRIWRAEGLRTAALVAQHGQQAPGWLDVYDQTGGLLAAYRGMAERAPKVMLLDAQAGGALHVMLHPPTAPALDLRDPEGSASLFGAFHDVDLLGHRGEFPQARPEQLLGDICRRSMATERSSLEDRAYPVLDHGGAAPELSPLVSGGVPLPRGALREADRARLLRDGIPQPLQTRVTGWWPDGSIKWLLLTFPLQPEKVIRSSNGAGDSLPLNITLRAGPDQQVQLHYGPGVAPVQAQRSLQVDQQGDSVTLDSGPLRVRLATGPRWLASVTLHGRELVAAGSAPMPPLACADFLRSADGYDVNSTHPAGERDPGPVVIESIELQESGPLRAVVKLVGRAMSAQPAQIVLRVTVHAGRPWLHLSHSIVFMHGDPRTTFLRRLVVTLPVALGSDDRQVKVSGESCTHPLAATGRVALRQHSHLHGDVVHVAQGHARRWAEHRRTLGWIDLRARGGGVAVILRDLWQSYPKALVADADAAHLSVELWPQSAPLMDVRRYSQRPHVAQGESTRSGLDKARDTGDWVQDVYDREEPFVGVSRTHEMLWVFHDGSMPTSELDAVAADFQSPPLIHAGAAWYRQTGITMANPGPQAQPQMVGNLDAMTDFWLFHQRRWGWYGLWDYGDLRHSIANGHGWIVPPDELARWLAIPAKDRPREGFAIQLDYSPEQDWGFDNGRSGWSNTEGLPGLFLQDQYLRTGRRDVYFAAEALARHVRDVDMRHAGRWLGRGTRHGVQHWSDGNHEERQTVHGEFRWIYHLSGDARFLDLANLLCREIYTRQPTRLHADHSGRLMGLLANWEFSGDPQLGQLLREYVEQLVVPQGLAISPQIHFDPRPSRRAVADVNSGNMFFHGFGGMHALIEYVQWTDDMAARQAMIRMAQAMLQDPATQQDIARGEFHVWQFFQPVMAFAATHAADPSPFVQALRQWRDAGGWRILYHTAIRNPVFWSDRHMPLRGNLSPIMMIMNWVAYVAAAVPGGEELLPNQLAELQAAERQGLPSQHFRPSWQAEYDRPDLSAYLRS